MNNSIYGFIEARHAQAVQQLKVQSILPESNKTVYTSQLMNKPLWSSICSKHLHMHFVLEQQLPTCWYMIHLTPMDISISGHFQKQQQQQDPPFPPPPPPSSSLSHLIFAQRSLHQEEQKLETESLAIGASIQASQTPLETLVAA